MGGASPAEIHCLSSIGLAGKTVLDVGCGCGRIAPIVTSLGGKYRGIDQSQAMIEAARQLHPGCIFDRADILSTQEVKYHVILLMHNTLGGFFPYSTRARVIRSVCDVLAPGGIFVFSSHVNQGPFDRSHRSIFDWPLRLFRCVKGGGYAVQNYHGERVLMFRATFDYLAKELKACGLTIDLVVPDDSRMPVDWVYYRVQRLA